jgi:hypothetical protein
VVCELFKKDSGFLTGPVIRYGCGQPLSWGPLLEDERSRSPSLKGCGGEGQGKTIPNDCQHVHYTATDANFINRVITSDIWANRFSRNYVLLPWCSEETLDEISNNALWGHILRKAITDPTACLWLYRLGIVVELTRAGS